MILLWLSGAQLALTVSFQACSNGLVIALCAQRSALLTRCALRRLELRVRLVGAARFIKLVATTRSRKELLTESVTVGTPSLRAGVLIVRCVQVLGDWDYVLAGGLLALILGEALVDL